MDLLDRIYKDLDNIFESDPKRLRHIYGVKDLAVYLGNKYNQDVYKCEVSALLHDICKNMPLSQQKKYIKDDEHSLIETNVLYHAYAAKNYAIDVYGITDNEILNAISSHVYGNLNMSMLDKIILLSDFCEQNREYKECIKTREVLLSGYFNKALQDCLKYTIESLRKRGLEPTKTQVLIYKKYME